MTSQQFHMKRRKVHGRLDLFSTQQEGTKMSNNHPLATANYAKHCLKYHTVKSTVRSYSFLNTSTAVSEKMTK